MFSEKELPHNTFAVFGGRAEAVSRAPSKELYIGDSGKLALNTCWLLEGKPSH